MQKVFPKTSKLDPRVVSFLRHEKSCSLPCTNIEVKLRASGLLNTEVTQQPKPEEAFYCRPFKIRLCSVLCTRVQERIHPADKALQ